MIDRSHLGLLTIREAADLAGVRPGTVASWISRYGLPTRSQGRQTLVSELALLECERARRQERRGRKRSWRTGRGKP